MPERITKLHITRHKLVIYYGHYKSLWYCSNMREVERFTAMLDAKGVTYKFYAADRLPE